jgi:peptidyl-prolyl cis-trans isomerase B (cyclophilin B)
MKVRSIFFAISVLVLSVFNATAQVKKTVASEKKVVVPVKKTTVTAPPANPSKETVGNTKVEITTDLGVIVIKLYDSTPKHRDNFVKLVAQKFYDSLLFHRIIQGFMIQGGDPLSKNAQPGTMLGMGGGEMERIPAEFNKNIIHRKGALCAARDGNPQKASSACQFYIVQGNPTPEDQLKMMSQQKGYEYTPEQINIYKTLGGTPFLDMEYTVFGEVVSGLDVLDKIAAVKKDQSDRPLTDVKMKMELIK